MDSFVSWGFFILAMCLAEWLSRRELRLRNANAELRTAVLDIATDLAALAIDPDTELQALEALETDPSFPLEPSDIEALCRYAIALQAAREDCLQTIRDLRDPDADNILAEAH